MGWAGGVGQGGGCWETQQKCASLGQKLEQQLASKTDGRGPQAEGTSCVSKWRKLQRCH